ncbi:hypothetical protein QSU92_01810 [Microbacterium sp. ET2]|uniref:hypothetical protein n=1 Tax=Microbacterium albipurpureum TaxID=3050384 RepID=UPI00259D0768|nr:hypothetical protein [Microbacterium sp. ET2 (Ac-2212)]WJL95976.1 hypothetical protein QSU92_01810 [Microbacterium sp. ET2 (Ac-2212)]
MERRRFLLAGLAAASMIAFVGCSDAETDVPQTPAAVATYEYRYGDGANAAPIVGVLDFSSGCVRFEDGSVPVFASAAIEWVGDALLIEGDPYRDGDLLDSGGGEYSQPLKEGLSIPTECEGHRYLGIGPSRDFMRSFPPPVARPCHGEFIADVDTSAEGAASPAEAADAGGWIVSGLNCASPSDTTG